MSDFREKSTIRGIRNNNPGNIRISPTPWQGKVPKNANTDGAFEQFESMEYGIRAMIINLLSYFRRSVNTPAMVICTWAPPSENHTRLYVDFVAKKLGLGWNEVIPLTQEKIIALSKAIAYYENGIKQAKLIPDSDFQKGYELALPHIQSLKPRAMTAQEREQMEANLVKAGLKKK